MRVTVVKLNSSKRNSYGLRGRRVVVYPLWSYEGHKGVFSWSVIGLLFLLRITSPVLIFVFVNRLLFLLWIVKWVLFSSVNRDSPSHSTAHLFTPEAEHMAGDVGIIGIASDTASFHVSGVIQTGACQHIEQPYQVLLCLKIKHSQLRTWSQVLIRHQVASWLVYKRTHSRTHLCTHTICVYYYVWRSRNLLC
jgi:hypothetical protein